MNEPAFHQWIGRSETVSDPASARQVGGFRALLDDMAPACSAGLLPPLAHWLHFLPQVAQSQVDTDGHPRRGGLSLLPAIELPRRMWAGGRLQFLGDIALGAEMERRSTIVSVTPKEGRSGRMVFVTLAHEIASAGRIAIREEQDIVYREGGGTVAATEPLTDRPPPPGGRRVTLDAVALFRYSALTFNGHRIHYDRDYARDVEGYPGLVVQGPLIATLLLAHATRLRPDARVRTFSFRAERPLFDGDAFDLVTDGADLAAIRPDGTRAMIADITFDTGSPD